ncbi:hypothetical protein CFter6_1037 [Collimonas fungivorans]|uniref:Uncharacterized protein n=1 Tax=Collimonas fungivorans TaxID=158899 RepID=A0A127P7W2_9BURK|nr:hypothetical protein CFter6_1037 [Collimonas fungivorans]
MQETGGSFRIRLNPASGGRQDAGREIDLSCRSWHPIYHLN